jgi:TolB-like protein/Tfp pilus assembly protein PilF
MPLEEKRVYRFGPFCLDTGSRLLHREGELIPLAPKTLDTLLALVERSGDVLDKQDLLKKVWPDTFVEEGSLAQNISILRRVLGECADGQQYIQTIPKRGYRFVASLNESLSALGRGEPLGPVESGQPVPSIAVLPFANMSGDPDREYFSDGLAEEIINALAQIPGLKVTARTSAFAFRGKEQDITRIAEALRVRTILEGSVRKSGNRVRVTVQLINAADGYHLWGCRYDKDLADLFAVQDEIAAAIGEALKLKLIGRPARRYQPNLPAYDAFLKGRHELSKLEAGPTAAAKDFLERAIALDPQYPEPHAELGQYYLLRAGMGLYPADEMMSAARAEAQKAVELSAADSRAHGVLCAVAGGYDFDWKEAERHFHLALATDPVPPEVRGRCALSYLLPLGRFEEALTQFEKALEQNPLLITSRALFAWALVAAGLYDRALVEAEKCLQISHNHWMALSAMTVASVQRADLAKARRFAEMALQAAPWRARLVGMLAGILARLGEVEPLPGLLTRLTEMDPSGLFWYHLFCFEIDAAADYYAQVIELRDTPAIWFAAASFLSPLRSSPRWPALARMMNLPERSRSEP